MNKTLTALYDSFYTPPQAADTRAEIKAIHKQLILKLDKPERRLVLRLIDAKDRLAEETSMDSSVCGFRLAWRLANELNSYSESGRPTQSGRRRRAGPRSPPDRRRKRCPPQTGHPRRIPPAYCWTAGSPARSARPPACTRPFPRERSRRSRSYQLRQIFVSSHTPHRHPPGVGWFHHSTGRGFCQDTR